MAKVKAPRKISRKHELRQDAVITFWASAHDYAEKNRALIIGAVAAVAVIILLIAAYLFYQSRQEARAAELLGGIVTYYERGDYQQALEGLPDRQGLIEIAENYGRTNEGNLARFYAADAFYRIGQYDEALRYFEQFRKGNDYVGASAYAGMAAIYEDRGDHARAAEEYQRAARTADNEVTSPLYLMSAARNRELAGNYQQARELYASIRDNYPESPQAANVNVYLARIDAMTANN